jgi:hypothetical protein
LPSAVGIPSFRTSLQVLGVINSSIEMTQVRPSTDLKLTGVPDITSASEMSCVKIRWSPDLLKWE